jgi:hypothetical protein
VAEPLGPTVVRKPDPPSGRRLAGPFDVAQGRQDRRVRFPLHDVESLNDFSFDSRIVMRYSNCYIE